MLRSPVPAGTSRWGRGRQGIDGGFINETMTLKNSLKLFSPFVFSLYQPCAVKRGRSAQMMKAACDRVLARYFPVNVNAQ